MIKLKYRGHLLCTDMKVREKWKIFSRRKWILPKGKTLFS